MIIDLLHFTKACWNGNANSVRFYDSIRHEWYCKDYINYFDSKGKTRELKFAFFDFEAAMNINMTLKQRDIDVLVAYISGVGNKKDIVAIGVDKIAEELLK